MFEILISALIVIASFGLIILSLISIYMKMYYHFKYLKQSKGYFGANNGIVDYLLDPIERFSKPIEFVELSAPIIFRDKNLENQDPKLMLLGKRIFLMLVGFYSTIVLFLILESI